MPVWLYTCQNATLLEITCHSSFFYPTLTLKIDSYILISQPKHMLWVLKITVSMRWFF